SCHEGSGFEMNPGSNVAAVRLASKALPIKVADMWGSPLTGGVPGLSLRRLPRDRAAQASHPDEGRKIRDAGSGAAFGGYASFNPNPTVPRYQAGEHQCWAERTPARRVRRIGWRSSKQHSQRRASLALSGCFMLTAIGAM